VKQALKDEGAYCAIVSTKLGKLRASDGQEFEPDKTFTTSGSIMFDAVYVPGGQASVETLMKKGDAIHFINEAFKHCKPIAASGEGVQLFQKAYLDGIALSTDATRSDVVSDQGVVTLRDSAAIGEFARTFIAAIAQHRYWMREQKEMVPA
jgi:catalase